MKKYTWPIGAVVIVVLIVAAIVLLNSGPDNGGADQIEIGVSLPLTGDGAAYGQEVKKGIDLALDELNAAGGIQGKRITLVYEDDRGESAAAVSAFQKLISTDHVPAVIGGAFSAQAMAIAPIAHGTVVFCGPDAAAGVGNIDGNGHYTLKTGTADGVAPGEYTVTVSAFKPPPAGSIDPVPPQLITPEKYNRVETSDLKAEVSPGQNTCNFELTSQ